MANYPSLIAFVGLFAYVQCELLFQPIEEQASKLNADPFYGTQEASPLIDVDFATFEQQNQEEKPQSNEFNVPTSIGETSGIVINGKGQLVVLHRGDQVWDQNSFDEKTNVFNKKEVILNATIAVIDPSTGDLIGEYGRGLFYMPHGLSLDPEGNYWVTDVARHQVFKLDPNFKPLLVLGEKMIPGSDETHFCKPTDVAVAKSGEIFVADGYCNNRIIKLSADGKFLSSFGSPNSDEKKLQKGEFNVPHSLALIEDLNLLCVADRDNQRIQCFSAGIAPKGAHQRFISPTGTFVTKAENIGKIMAIREKNHYLVGVTNTEPETKNEYQLFIMDINTGKASTFAKGIEDAHALALGDNPEVYIAQLKLRQVVKYDIPGSAEVQPDSVQ